MEIELADQAATDPEWVDDYASTAPDVEDLQSSQATIDQVDALLDEVEGALSRIDDGTYGTCSSCGSAIDDLVLASTPTAQLCPACVTPEVD
jgi:DnaK suppressor protein